jgi:hypothetical protein
VDVLGYSLADNWVSVFVDHLAECHLGAAKLTIVGFLGKGSYFREFQSRIPEHRWHFRVLLSH